MYYCTVFAQFRHFITFSVLNTAYSILAAVRCQINFYLAHVIMYFFCCFSKNLLDYRKVHIISISKWEKKVPRCFGSQNESLCISIVLVMFLTRFCSRRVHTDCIRNKKHKQYFRSQTTHVENRPQTIALFIFHIQKRFVTFYSVCNITCKHIDSMHIRYVVRTYSIVCNAFAIVNGFYAECSLFFSFTKYIQI